MLPDDLLITISGSGNSKNVIRAAQVANDLKVTTLTISGYDGGKLSEISNYSVRINSFDMQICEDAHVVFGHLVMKSLCKLDISS
jgi:D-sedoheptulose 7-phosphate isomerase